ncbi:MAG: AAA family ATPase [Nanoarchaeota archaeon]
MIIAITGTPGTGKTTLAKEISEKTSIPIIDIDRFLDDKTVLKYDQERETKIVDEEKLAKIVERYILKESITDGIIDSHLSHYFSTKIVDICIVISCDIKILKKRLEKRGYNELKVSENLETEAFDEILHEAEESGHNIIHIDNSKKIDVKKIIEQIKKNKN